MFEHLTDEMLLDELYNAVAKLRYYEAAEGEWAGETETRRLTRNHFARLFVEVNDRHLTIDMDKYSPIKPSNAKD